MINYSTKSRTFPVPRYDVQLFVTKITISYFIINNQNPVKDFIDSLPYQNKTKIFRLFQTIEEYGLSSVLPHIKKLSNTPLYELRILGKDSLRIIYLTPNQQNLIILHGFIKKTQKTPQKELSIALKRYQQYIAQ